MPKMQPIQIIGVDQPPEFTLNGEQAIVALAVQGGTILQVQIDRRALAMLVARLTRAHLSMEYVAATRGGPIEAPAADAEQVRAQTPNFDIRPTLTVRSGLLQHFSVSPEQAEALAAELQSAAARARENKRSQQ